MVMLVYAMSTVIRTLRYYMFYWLPFLCELLTFVRGQGGLKLYYDFSVKLVL